jgi:hypothetical protein
VGNCHGSLMALLGLLAKIGYNNFNNFLKICLKKGLFFFLCFFVVAQSQGGTRFSYIGKTFCDFLHT